MQINDIATPELIEKYAVSGPRYTSYPTAVEFQTSYSQREWLSELAELGLTGTSDSPVPLSLYVHIPFCRSLCLFCACSRSITNDRSVVAPYLDALELEVRRYRQQIGNNTLIRQIHWGGGTPNYLDPEEMERLGEVLLESFPELDPDADRSVELDPRTTTSGHLDALRKMGMNRISIGIQDFDPEVQKAVNRVQSVEATEALVGQARELGFGSINFDLIYGLPGQTLAGLSRTIESVLRLAPDRIALYGYAHVTWRSKAQNSLSSRGLPNPAQRLQFFLQSVRQLVSAGYVYIGMDHFARESDSLAQALENGQLRRNFMGYSTHKDVSLLGFGASAISTLSSSFAQNCRDVESYQRSIKESGLATERGLRRSSEDQMRGDIIEQVLCAGTLSFDKLAQRWGQPFESILTHVQHELRGFADDGLIEITPDSLRVTSRGRFFVRNLAMIFDDYLAKYRQKTEKTFSQAI